MLTTRTATKNNNSKPAQYVIPKFTRENEFFVAMPVILPGGKDGGQLSVVTFDEPSRDISNSILSVPDIQDKLVALGKTHLLLLLNNAYNTKVNADGEEFKQHTQVQEKRVDGNRLVIILGDKIKGSKNSKGSKPESGEALKISSKEEGIKLEFIYDNSINVLELRRLAIGTKLLETLGFKKCNSSKYTSSSDDCNSLIELIKVGETDNSQYEKNQNGFKQLTNSELNENNVASIRQKYGISLFALITAHNALLKEFPTRWDGYNEVKKVSSAFGSKLEICRLLRILNDKSRLLGIIRYKCIYSSQGPSQQKFYFTSFVFSNSRLADFYFQRSKISMLEESESERKSRLFLIYEKLYETLAIWRKGYYGLIKKTSNVVENQAALNQYQKLFTLVTDSAKIFQSCNIDDLTSTVVSLKHKDDELLSNEEITRAIILLEKLKYCKPSKPSVVPPIDSKADFRWGVALLILGCLGMFTDMTVASMLILKFGIAIFATAVPSSIVGVLLVTMVITGAILLCRSKEALSNLNVAKPVELLLPKQPNDISLNKTTVVIPELDVANLTSIICNNTTSRNLCSK
jgi:hypothetical protein